MKFEALKVVKLVSEANEIEFEKRSRIACIERYLYMKWSIARLMATNTRMGITFLQYTKFMHTVWLV